MAGDLVPGNIGEEGGEGMEDEGEGSEGFDDDNYFPQW